MMFRTILFILTFVYSFHLNDGTEKELKMVNLVYRHGARSPRAFYPTDPYQDNFWPDGLGRLTQYGMQLEYGLGKFFKERYMVTNKLLNEQYRHKEVYIRSSDSERAIQSAQCQLAGLYPPKGYQVWNKQIPWQPIPVHTLPKNEDVELLPHRVTCPRLVQIWAEKRTTEEFKKKLIETKPLLQNISNHTGMRIDFDNLYFFTDSTRCEKAEKLKLKQWIRAIWKEAADLEDWWHILHYSGDDELATLLGGSLLWKMNDNMKRFAGNIDVGDLHKLNIWSAHDTTLLSLCAALGFKCHLPDYASSIMIELYYSVKQGYTVEVQYRKDHTNEVIPWTIKGCAQSCPLQRFLELTSVRTTSDRSKLCKRKDDFVGSAVGFFEDDRTMKIAVYVLGCSFFCILILMMFCFARFSSFFRKKYTGNVEEDKSMLIHCTY